jgi:glycosyltransferase involved in cell wall biosynthesis
MQMSWHLITCEYPPDIGGISDHTAQLAGGLAAADEEVHVWCPGRPGSAEVSRTSGRTDVAGALHDGVRVHAVMGAFGLADLVRAGAALDACPGPRRLLVQWLPHGYGQRSLNLGFCVWVAGRARRGDRVDLVVHEPFLELAAQPVRHLVMALVHRLMTVVLLRAVHRVWVSTPAWEPRLRPFALGRPLDIRWLPVPGCESLRAAHASAPAAATRRPLVGHFGSYGTLVTSLLEERLARVLAGRSRPDALLLGAGSEAFATAFLAAHPEFAGRVHASGVLPPQALAEMLASCDVLLQPYPDGITVRRTSAMAGLAQGRPIVTTTGHLTEPSWADQGAVALVPLVDVEGFAASAEHLLTDREARARLGARALEVYHDHFSVDRLVRTLRAVA